MPKKKHKGKCAVCGNFDELTFEHIPPKSALNSKPIRFQNGEQLFERESKLFESTSKLHQGFGKYCLCANCNSFLGANYVNEYKDFVNNCHKDFPKTVVLDDFCVWSFSIKPLNLIKQISAMFMCLNQELLEKKDYETLRDFVMNKDSKQFPNQLKIYIYNYVGKPKFIGLQVAYKNGKIVRCSEIDFYPFGFQMTFNSEPASEYIQDITAFCNYDYNQVKNIKIALQIRSGKLPFIGN